MRALSDRARRRARRAGCLALIGLAATAARPARASGHLPPICEVCSFAIPALFFPSELGVVVTDAPHFGLGWSLQIPDPEAMEHRLVAGVNVLPDGGAHDVQGRIGYRFAPGRVFAGLGLSFDRTRESWSPELGVNLLSRKTYGPGGGLHLLARAEIAPALNQLRGGSLLLGWTLL